MRLLAGAVLALAAASACRRAAPDGFTLLFFGRSPAASLDGFFWAPDPDNSRLVALDKDLRVARSLSSPRLALPMAVASLGDRLLVTERTGQGVVLDTAGHAVREWEGPNAASLYAVAPGATRIVAVRSPYFVQLGVETDTAPLIRILDSLGRPVEGLGAIRVPPVPYLTELANAGAVAVAADGSIYFAPLVRDEILKYAPGGVVRWTARRGLYKEEKDPELLPPRRGGRDLQVRHAVVNVALALGPDGRLYALGAEDSSAKRLRLDVLDTATGHILDTRSLGAAPPRVAVALDPNGRVTLLDADSLLASAPERPRDAFGPAFALLSLAGDTVSLQSFRGKVTLVNFWASWCDPCREEFPHMAQLYGQFARGDFAIAAISDDVDQGKMLAFVREFRPPFPILVGGGRMREVYHYRGLPYSVLLDRRGRIVERIFGFGGATEFAELRATIAKEVAAP